MLGPSGFDPYFAYKVGSGGYENDHPSQVGANIVAGFVRDLVVEAKVPVLSAAVRCPEGTNSPASTAASPGCPVGPPPTAELPPIP